MCGLIPPHLTQQQSEVNKEDDTSEIMTRAQYWLENSIA